MAEATVQWLNRYMNGLAGHRITLEVCVDNLEPGKAIDCANQMIREGVVAVLPASGTIEASWQILRDAGIPMIILGAAQQAILEDTASSFVLNDPQTGIVDLPIEVAKDVGATVVSVIVVDLPAATEGFEGRTRRMFERAGLELRLFPIPLGTPDMTPQMQRLVSDNPDGVVAIIGHDQFCIPAINGLEAVGFEGTTVVISPCVTDATRQAIPGDALEGIVTSASAPIGDNKDPSVRQYNAVLDKYAEGDPDPESTVNESVFQGLSALSVGTRGLTGEVTPASVTAAMKGMDSEVLPGSGGRHFRCNGNASRAGAAVCVRSFLVATLDAEGNPVKYRVRDDSAIPD